MGAAQFRTRTDYLNHAAVGLDESKRRQADELLQRRLRDGTLSMASGREMSKAAKSIERCAGADAIAETLLAALEVASGGYEQMELVEDLAEMVGLKVEHPHNASVTKSPLDPDTARWAASIADDLAAKLAAVGLIPKRPKAVTLAGLLVLYAAEKEAGNKPGTRTNHRTITNDLTKFFKPTTDPRALTEADAKQFVEHLRARKLAGYTVSRRVRRARSIFAFAVKAKLIPTNPFADLKTPASLPEDRKAYVTIADTSRLTAVANPTWRTIIALCRFAGLRCPSEVFRLKWSDVNFATGRMTIPNVKTAGQTGKEYRVCPIFNPLRPHLEDAYELAEPGTVYVVSGAMADNVRAKMDGPNGSNDANTRTVFMKLIKRAGLTPWPRLFHTLRASCETDLLERFPISAVTEWLGHSAAVALKHYSRVPDHLFERATGGGAESGAWAAQNQTEADATRRKKTEATETPGIGSFRRLLSGLDRSSPDASLTPRGFDTAGDTAEKSAISNMPAQQTSQIPAHPPVVGPLAAFVASLTP